MNNVGLEVFSYLQDSELIKFEQELFLLTNWN